MGFNPPRVERYDILAKIAEGGMGEVFLAQASGEHGFRKTVAIKRIHARLAADPEFVLRFVSEAKVAVSLSHANVVHVLDLARSHDELFLVMEYIHGVDLRRVRQELETQGARMPAGVLLQLASGALQGLAYAHGFRGDGSGLIHCDVSLANLLVSYAGELKIADFGVAQLGAGRQTADGRVMGNPRFMSPEQTRGERLDARADLFSLGRVLETLAEVTDAAPAGLAQLIARATSADKARRPSNALEMLKEVSELSWAHGPPITAPEVGAWLAHVVPPPPSSASNGPAFAGAVKQLLGERASTGTRSAAEAVSRTFVVQGYDGGTMQWAAVEASSAAPPSPKRFRWALPAAAVGLAAVLGSAAGLHLLRSHAQPARAGAPAASAPVVNTPAVNTPAVNTPAASTPAPGSLPAVAPTRPRTKPALGALNIFTDPWATARVDGRVVGTTPIHQLALAEGKHHVLLEHPHRSTVGRWVNIRRGQTTLLDVELANP